MTVVVDASVVVAGLVSADATGRWAESVLAGEVSADAAALAHADLRRLRVEYFPYDPFAERVWELRGPGLAAPPERDPAGGAGRHAEGLGYSYEQQVEMLQRVRRGVADCDAARQRAERQMTALAESAGELERRAGEARAAGQPGLAREALARRDAVEAELGELRDQGRSLRQQSERLAVAAQRLQAKLDALAARRQQAGERAGRPGLTSYEAWYVALAEFLGARLATLDAGLALALGPRCGFCLPPRPPA